jgi:hypothetical protein
VELLALSHSEQRCPARAGAVRRRNAAARRASLIYGQAVEDLLLRHIYACARTQDLLDVGVSYFIKERMPNLGPVIVSRWLDRTNDADRLKMLHAVAVEAEYSIDLSNFDSVYLDAIDLRNRLAHGGAMRSTVVGQVIVDRTPRQRGKGAPFVHLDRNDLLSHVLRAEWLQSIAAHFAVELGAVTASIVVGEGRTAPHKIDAPASDPPNHGCA